MSIALLDLAVYAMLRNYIYINSFPLSIQDVLPCLPSLDHSPGEPKTPPRILDFVWPQTDKQDCRMSIHTHTQYLQRPRLYLKSS